MILQRGAEGPLAPPDCATCRHGLTNRLELLFLFQKKNLGFKFYASTFMLFLFLWFMNNLKNERIGFC